MQDIEDEKFIIETDIIGVKMLLDTFTTHLQEALTDASMKDICKALVFKSMADQIVAQFTSKGIEESMQQEILLQALKRERETKKDEEGQ